MLRETKIGILVACSFLGLLGTVFTMKYRGDPLAAELHAASNPDSSAWLDSTPVASENSSAVSPPTPVAEPAASRPTPHLETVGNPGEIKLVSAPNSVPPSTNTDTHPPAHQPVDHVTAPPQITEPPPSSAPLLASADPPGPAAAVEAPAASEGAAHHESPPAAKEPDPAAPAAKPDDPLSMPAPEKVIDQRGSNPVTASNPGPETGTPAVAALGAASNPSIAPVPPEPSSPPAATLGAPGAVPDSALHHPVPTAPAASTLPPENLSSLAANPPPAIGSLAAGGPGSQPTAPAAHGSTLGGPIAAVSPPISVPTPARSAPIVPQVASFDEETYQCRPGDTMKGIAQQHYHSDKYEQALLQYNRDYPLATENIRSNPGTLPPGQPVYIPQVSVLESRYASLIPGLTPLPKPAIAVATPPAAPRPYQVHTATGEMMRDIAGRTLGNPERWVDILHLNPGFNPAQPVPAGTMLQLPPDAHP